MFVNQTPIALFDFLAWVYNIFRLQKKAVTSIEPATN
jgi:hypothetical protein